MDDLISRKALIDYVKAWQIGCGVGHDQKTFINAIVEQPTVEAKPVVYGEWKYSRKENIATCKNCSYEHYLGTYHQYATNFCPNCGSDMRKKVQDGNQ